MDRLRRKLRDVVRLLRYGPTRLAQLSDRQAALEERLQQESHALAQLRQGEIEPLRQELTHLIQQVMRKAADADLQFVRNALHAQIEREAGWLRDRMGAIEGSLAQRPSGQEAPGAQPAASGGPREEAFYLALERHFRGTADELRERMQAYQPWVADLPPGPVVDLGCGRGEWLQLLQQWGRQARGVDLNPLNTREAQALGLDVTCGDALQWLQALPDQSCAAVSSFHVVEHLPFGMLLRLVDQCRRVLKPGGRLILETPNPENLLVATQGFWLDPTHQRPLPPPLLEFVVAQAGLALETTLRLHPPAADTLESAPEALRPWLGVGRDYAVIGRRAAAEA